MSRTYTVVTTVVRTCLCHVRKESEAEAVEGARRGVPRSRWVMARGKAVIALAVAYRGGDRRALVRVNGG